MDHISGHKSVIESIEVPIDRAHPDDQHTKFSRIAVHFDGRGWPLK